MSKHNPNKAQLQFATQWDNAFNDGYRAGYNDDTSCCDCFSHTYQQAFKQGYETGKARLERELKAAKRGGYTAPQQNNPHIGIFDSAT